MIDFGERGNRRFVVRQDFPIERNKVALTRIAAELVKAEGVRGSRHTDSHYSVFTISFCPTSMMSSCSLFHFFNLSVLTP